MDEVLVHVQHFSSKDDLISTIVRLIVIAFSVASPSMDALKAPIWQNVLVVFALSVKTMVFSSNLMWCQS